MEQMDESGQVKCLIRHVRYKSKRMNMRRESICGSVLVRVLCYVRYHLGWRIAKLYTALLLHVLVAFLAKDRAVANVEHSLQ